MNVDENQVQICSGGGHKQILSAMRRHANDLLVQEFGCEALWNLARHEDHRGRLAETDAVTQVLTAMETHKWEPAIQAEGVGALCYLALDRRNEVEIGKNKGIEIITQGMKRFVKNRKIQDRSCQALLVLSSYDHNQMLSLIHI